MAAPFAFRHVVVVGGMVLALGAALGLGSVGALEVIGAPAAGATSSTLYVSTSGNGTTPSAGCTTGYATIQDAVTEAVSGDTIDVCPGTYPEQVEITKSDLKIVGSGSSGVDATVVEPTLNNTIAPFDFTDTNFPLGFTPYKVVPIIYVTPDETGVTLSDLQVNADDSEEEDPGYLFGIYYAATSSGDITDVTYTGTPTTAHSGGSQNTAIFADYGTTMSITNSHVSEFYKEGIVCAGDCTITGNTVTGVGPTGVDVGPISSGEFGIGMYEGATGTVSDNTVSDDDYVSQSDIATGIRVAEASNVSVTDNTLTDDNVGISVQSLGKDDGVTSTAAKVSGVTVTDNTIDYNSTYTTGADGTLDNADGTQGVVVASYAGPHPSSVSAVVEDNTLDGPGFDDSSVTPDVTDTGLQVGDQNATPGSQFATVGGALSVTAAGNTFSGWTADATVLGTNDGSATADLELNNFEGASEFGVDNLSGTADSEGSGGTGTTTAVTVDATSNWWGCTTGPSTTSPCVAASSGVDDAPVLASAMVSGVSSSGTATATNAGTTVTASGNGVVNLGQYSGNPEAGALESTTGVYFDANLSPGNTFTGVTVNACDLNGGDSLSWWDGTAWQAVTPQSYVAGTPSCVTADLTSSSSPSVSELTGTVFGVVAPAPSSPSAPSTPQAPSAPTAPSGAASHQSCSVTSGTLTCTNDGVTVTASSGPGALTVSQYSSNPETTPGFTSTGEYFDVQVASGSAFTTLTVKDCNLSGATLLYWWDATTMTWETVAPVSGPTGTPPCLTAALSSTSTPTIGELTGTVFAAGTAAVPGTARVAGNTADATAAAEFTRAFPYTKDSCPSSRAVVLATTKTYQDALSSQLLAGSLTTGTLLTPTESLSTVTATTLKEEGIKTVYVVGGPLAVTTTVVEAIESLTAYGCNGTTPTGKITVTRIYGETQYGTAEAVAEHVGAAASKAFPGAYATTDATGGSGRYNDTTGKGSTAPSGSVATAILASGEEFQDAQAASVVSYRTKLPLLLTEATTLSTTAVAAIGKLGVKQLILMGGPLAVTNTVEAALVAKTGVSVLRVAGEDYTDTAAELARFEVATSTDGLGWTPGHRVMVARGNGFTDGLAGAVLENGHNATTGASGTARPLLLTESPTTVGSYLTTFLKVTAHTGIDKTAGKTITALSVLGGTLAVSTTEVTQMLTDLSH